MIKIKFYNSVNDKLLKYAVIIAKYNNQWVFCKHKERNTLEIPGGHREVNETIIDCAKRELYEETGSTKYSLRPICVYSVVQNTIETYGMLYYADIQLFDKELHCEIEKIVLLDTLPDNWTYPSIQPLLIQEYEKRSS